MKLSIVTYCGYPTIPETEFIYGSASIIPSFFDPLLSQPFIRTGLLKIFITGYSIQSIFLL